VHLKKLGRYDLVRVLGKGAMGVVYEGRDPNLDRQVAIKTIMVDGLGPVAAAEYEERFRTEARSAARLQHPNIVTVYDSDRDGDTAFLVMEFVAGDDLKQMLDGGGRYEVEDALHLVHDMLAALEFAHRQGVIHRDIKPANLLVEKGGRVKLTDFGVARIAGEATRTQGSMIGTLKYMAPEQVQGQKVDARADLFSAAVVAYQLLTGARPFDGDNDFSIIHQVIGHTPATPTSLVPELPAAVDAVFARAMAKDRDQRFPTAGEFWQALREAFPHLDLPAITVAAPAARVPGAPTITMPPPGRAPTVPGGQITQELELEYWRAVRDSTDRRELEGFLQRFPEGIYADLARRRLQRLASPEDPELTVLRGMTGGEPTATLPLHREEGEEERAWQALTSASPPPQAKPVPSRAPAAHVESTLPLPRPAPVRRWAGAAAALIAVAFVAVLFWARSSGKETGDSAAVTAASAAPAASATATAAPTGSASTAASPSTAVPQTAITPASAVRQVANAPAGPAAPARRPAASSAPSTSVASAAPALAPSTEHAREEVVSSAQGAAPRGRLTPPAETCKDKIFLLKEFCLQSECAKPGYQAFPACVRLKEEARLRDESRVRN
jgi:serine/threonine-protein kinase